MARVQNAMVLRVDPETAQRMYLQRPGQLSETVPRDLPLTEGMIDCLPEPVRGVVFGLVRKGGVRAHLLAQEDTLTVEIRNKKPRVSK